MRLRLGKGNGKREMKTGQEKKGALRNGEMGRGKNGQGKGQKVDEMI